MSSNTLADKLSAWVDAAYRQHSQMRQQAQGEENAAHRALLEVEASALYGALLTVVDYLSTCRTEGSLRQALIQQMREYERRSEQLLQEAGADDPQVAKRVDQSAIYRQVLQEWRKILRGK